MSASSVVELRLAHLAELDAHLRREQLLAQRRVVVQLGVDRRGDLVEHEPHAADEQRVEDEHQRILNARFQLQPDVDEVVRRPRARCT